MSSSEPDGSLDENIS